MAKQTGIAGFVPPKRSQQRMTPELKPTKGTSEIVAVTVRLPREDWQRLVDHARQKHVSLQALMVHGCSLTLEVDGLAPLKSAVARRHDVKAA